MARSSGSKHHVWEVTAYVRSLMRTRRAEGATLRAVGEEFGVSHAHVKGIVDHGKNVGPSLEHTIAEKRFDGSTDKLREAARLFALDNPDEVKQPHIVQYDATNPKEAVMQTPSFHDASIHVRRAFTTRAPYTPNDKFPDFDAYMRLLFRLKDNEDLLPADAEPDDLEDPGFLDQSKWQDVGPKGK